MTKHLRASVGACVVAIVTTGCSRSETAPSPSTVRPTVNSIVVSGTTASADTYQLNANARLSDGNTKDVTSSAQWQSSNTNVAQVSPAGLLKIVNTGRVDVQATYENITGSLSLAVTMASSVVQLTGFVSEAPPSARLLDGVRIAMTSGENAGVFTFSNEMGLFRFQPLRPGTVTLAIDRAGYQPWSKTLKLDEDLNLPIVLYPQPPKDAMGATATARCRDGSWSWAQTFETACTAQGGLAYKVCPGVLC